MNGSPAKMGTISGTAGHGSALKMKAEENAASALKQMELSKEETKGKIKRVDEDGNPVGIDLTINATGTEVTTKKGKKVKLDTEGEYGKSHKAIQDLRWKKGDKASGGTLNELVSARKGHKKGSAEYAAIQNKINSALGSKKVHKVTAKASTTTTKPNKIEKVVKKGEDKKVKIADKAAKRTGEVVENVDRKTAKITRKAAKKTSGKGSVEHLEAKKAHLGAKESDRQGEAGGRKQGIFRRLSSKINKKRQTRTQNKIDKRKAEDNEIKEA